MARATLLLMCMMMGAPAIAGSPPPDSIAGKAAAASAAYEEHNWTKAEPLYEHLVQAQPDSMRNWYRLGVCLQGMGKHQRALDAFQKTQAMGMPVSIVGYNISAVYASMGQTDRAIGLLTEAVKLGYAQADQMSTDPDLQSIRGDARFASLIERAKHNQSPCDYKQENRQFDFWVGDWDVVTTNEDSPAGISHIERAIGNCVIWENWTSRGNTGYAGKSYNIYNTDLERWEQFWVDNKGGMIHFYGGLTNGVMDFYTDEIPQSDGTRLKRHLQFFSLGSNKVRQFSQGSTDGGKTWTVEYDLTYNRKN
jgi:tetratricopeptide (TPR) repeat protein